MREFFFLLVSTVYASFLILPTWFVEDSPESVQQTVEELRENLKESSTVSENKANANLSQAMVVGIACDVCKPEDVRKLANFALHELGSVDIWVSI